VALVVSIDHVAGRVKRDRDETACLGGDVIDGADIGLLCPNPAATAFSNAKYPSLVCISVDQQLTPTVQATRPEEPLVAERWVVGLEEVGGFAAEHCRRFAAAV